MLKFPLHTPILLITTGGKFIGQITYAGDTCLKIINVVERIFTPNGDFLYTDNELSGVLHFDRRQIIGFKSLDQNELYEIEQEETENVINNYHNILAQTNRAKFRLVKRINDKKGEPNDQSENS